MNLNLNIFKPVVEEIRRLTVALNAERRAKEEWKAAYEKLALQKSYEYQGTGQTQSKVISSDGRQMVKGVEAYTITSTAALFGVDYDTFVAGCARYGILHRPGARYWVPTETLKGAERMFRKNMGKAYFTVYGVKVLRQWVESGQVTFKTPKGASK